VSLLVIGCATISLRPKQTQDTARYETLMNARFDEITIRHVRFTKAIEGIDEALWSKWHVRMSARYSTSSGGLLSPRNPRISYQAKDVTLRTVLDALCREAHYRYQQTN
jgi:hypothetical protein